MTRGCLLTNKFVQMAYVTNDFDGAIGHLVEYIHYPDEVWSQIDAGIPRN